MMHRRQIVGTGLAAFVSVTLPTAVFASDDLVFEVRRNGSPIGTHRLLFDRHGTDLQVRIDIDLEVRLAFFTLYSYRHCNVETWRDGVLQSFASETDDNGDRLAVRAERDGNVFLVTNADGHREVSGALLPTTYWHRDFMRQNRWIDTQTGRLVGADVTHLGTQSLSMTSGSFDAEHFRLRGDLDMDLWYSNDRWVGLSFKGPDGSTIDYRLEQAPIREVSLR